MSGELRNRRIPNDDYQELTRPVQPLREGPRDKVVELADEVRVRTDQARRKASADRAAGNFLGRQGEEVSPEAAARAREHVAKEERRADREASAELRKHVLFRGGLHGRPGNGVGFDYLHSRKSRSIGEAGPMRYHKPERN